MIIEMYTTVRVGPTGPYTEAVSDLGPGGRDVWLALHNTAGFEFERKIIPPRSRIVVTDKEGTVEALLDFPAGGFAESPSFDQGLSAKEWLLLTSKERHSVVVTHSPTEFGAFVEWIHGVNLADATQLRKQRKATHVLVHS